MAVLRGDHVLKRVGNSTIYFQNPPVILSSAAIGGKKEGEGPLGKDFDLIIDDSLYGEKSWEKAECKMLKEAAQLAVNKAGLTLDDIDYFLAGDLLNQIITANFTARDLEIPFIGIYGACSTIMEGTALASILIDGGFAQNVLVATSSHHQTAERQYRAPNEQGVKHKPTAQWTVTAAGAAVISREGNGPCVTHATFGRVIDLGIMAPDDMGAAMAPAAADTIARHLNDTQRTPGDYDLMCSGDLASVGKGIVETLLEQKGINVGNKYTDGGVLIYDLETQNEVMAGGSGCGCIGSLMCGHFMKEMKKGTYQRLLLMGTGALLSPTSSLQGESIPGVAHAITVEMNPGKQGGS